MSVRLAVLALLAGLAGACGGAAPASQPAAKPKQDTSRFAAFAADPRVRVYTSRAWGFRTKSYVIEGPTGLVVIDTQFLPSGARELIAQAEAATGKKVELAIVLHANPDKFNGTATFQAHGARVVTSAQVLGQIPAVHAQRHGKFYADHAPDYPDEAPAPGAFGGETQAIKAAGLTLQAHVLSGPGCSANHVVVTWDGHLFAGDLVANGTHAWLEIGAAPDWLKRLQEMTALRPRFVHPGRGASGGPELLVKQAEYLNTFMETVATVGPVAEGDPAALDAAVEGVVDQMKAAYPDLGYPLFMQFGVVPEMKRQARAGAGR